jgi:hypothetical protein
METLQRTPDYHVDVDLLLKNPSAGRDDGLLPMSSEEYLKFRLLPTVRRRPPPLTTLSRFYTNL